MVGEKIVLGILGLVLLIYGLRAVIRGKIQLGSKKHEDLSLLVLKTPPTERTGTWARVLGGMILATGLFFCYVALFT